MYLFLALFWSGMVILAFVLGVQMSRRREGLDRKSKRELDNLREFKSDVTALAGEHMAYGDPLAPILLDKIRALPRSQS